MLIGAILGVGVATDTEEAGPDFGTVAACDEHAAAATAAAAAARPRPESSSWLVAPAADDRGTPSEAGSSLRSLGEELLDEAKDRSVESRLNLVVVKVKKMTQASRKENKCFSHLVRHFAHGT